MNCDKCGLCCKTYPIDIGYDDVMRWAIDCRKDILREVSFVNNYPEKGYAGFFIEKTLRSPKQPCPFLTKENSCSIYQTRPMVCRDFPEAKEFSSCCPNWSFDAYSHEWQRTLVNKQKLDMEKAVKFYRELLLILGEARS